VTIGYLFCFLSFIFMRHPSQSDCMSRSPCITTHTLGQPCHTSPEYISKEGDKLELPSDVGTFSPMCIHSNQLLEQISSQDPLRHHVRTCRRQHPESQGGPRRESVPACVIDWGAFCFSRQRKDVETVRYSVLLRYPFSHSYSCFSCPFSRTYMHSTAGRITQVRSPY